MNNILCSCLVLVLVTWASPAHAATMQVLATGLQSPTGLVIDAEGRLYVSEWGADRIIRMDAQGKATIVTEAVKRPAGLAFDGKGILHAASYADGCIYALDGEKPRLIASGLSSPTGLLWDDDSFLVANRNAGQIVRVTLDGARTTLSVGHTFPVGIARLSNGALAVSCYGGTVDMVDSEGRVTVLTDRLVTPGAGILADGDGLLVVDYGGNAVYRIAKNGTMEAIAQGLASPVGLVRMPDGRVAAASWGDGSIRILTE